MKQIELNDVALRESAQVKLGRMSPPDQQTYLKMLVEGGIDRVELGYPGSSKAQLEQTKSLVKFVSELPGTKKPHLSALAAATKKMVAAVAETGCDVCHIYIPSSQKLLKSIFPGVKYGRTIEEKQSWVLRTSVKMVEYARTKGFREIEYSPEDAARSNREYICKLVTAVIEAGATIINIPDTTGLRILGEFGELIRYIKATVPNINRVKISVHCHNDGDNSTNNALQAILAGADIIEGTFYGLGERSGMTKFEAVLMNVNTRKDIFADQYIGFDISRCVKIVNFIAGALGMPVPRHWAVVGWQNSICSSGGHQKAEVQAKNRSQGYYSWLPELYGHEKLELPISQSSSRAGMNKRLAELGYKLTSKELALVFKEAKAICDVKSEQSLDDRELIAIAQNAVRQVPYPIKVIQCQAVGGQGTIPVAVITIMVKGKKKQATATGDGPFDAIMKAVVEGAREFYPRLKKVEIKLVDWRPVPVNLGSEALADVYASMRFGRGKGQIHAGRDLHPDTIQASAQAFANCVSWYLYSLQGVSKKSRHSH